MLKLSRKNRQTKQAALERKILAMLSFFSVSIGLWENFRQLWLQENGLSAQDVSSITSVGLLVSVTGVIMVGCCVKMRQLKPFIAGTLGVKFVNLLLLLSLNASGNLPMIDLCIVIDVVTSYLVLTGVYPLITTVIKSNRVYSKRKLVEYLFRDVGVLVGGIILGQQAFGATVDYNICLLISMLFLGPAIMIMFEIDAKPTEIRPTKRGAALKYVIGSKLQILYMVYAFLAAMSFATALGLKMLVLTNYLHFSAGTATNYLLVVGLLSDVVGILALKYFTPKNDYITMSIKFGIRLIAYIMAIIADDPFVSLLAITWSILISTAYEDVTDGNYINIIPNRYQLSYNTIKHVMSYTGEAAGMLVCGLTYSFGVPCMLGASAIIMVFQMGIAYRLIYLRQRRHRVRHSASRMRYN